MGRRAPDVNKMTKTLYYAAFALGILVIGVVDAPGLPEIAGTAEAAAPKICVEGEHNGNPQTVCVRVWSEPST